MAQKLLIQNLPLGADEFSAPVQQQAEEIIHRCVGYHPENQCECRNAEELIPDSKPRDDPLILKITSEMTDVKLAGPRRGIHSGHGSEGHAAQSCEGEIKNWISHVQSESENFTKYEYDINEDINNGDTSLNGYAVNASLPSPTEGFETKEEIDLRIQSAIDFISYYTELSASFANPASGAYVDDSYRGEINSNKS